MNDPLLEFRKHFPTLDTCTYLISNSLGAMPVQARAALEEYADTWTARGVRAWAETWWEMSGAVGDEIGRLFCAPPGTVSMHQNVTLAEATVISCFDWRAKRNKVVYTDMNFPSVQYLYDGYARTLGAEIEVVKSPDGISVPTELLVEAIDEVVSLSISLLKLVLDKRSEGYRVFYKKGHDLNEILVVDDEGNEI